MAATLADLLLSGLGHLGVLAYRGPPTQSLGKTGAPNEVQADKVYLFSAQAEGAQGPSGQGQHLFNRASYSLDLFLPVVNLHIDENWRPVGLWREIYAVFHSMVGWVLVPLLLASLAGIVRRE